uniref:Uncharacterized protein n=1 Tax=Pyricularia oryzae (strain P131) TaxID=1143193 RepID=L7JIX9_PYRO1
MKGRKTFTARRGKVKNTTFGARGEGSEPRTPYSAELRSEHVVRFDHLTFLTPLNHSVFHAGQHQTYLARSFHHIRPYPLEYTGSRPLSPSQTSEGRTSTQVGDHWGILGVLTATGL